MFSLLYVDIHAQHLDGIRFIGMMEFIMNMDIYNRFSFLDTTGVTSNVSGIIRPI